MKSFTPQIRFGQRCLKPESVDSGYINLTQIGRDFNFEISQLTLDIVTGKRRLGLNSIGAAEVPDYIQMSYLGLDNSEVIALENMFTLVPELLESYQFNGSEQFADADIILVNADDPQALNMWNKISRVNKLATPLMLSCWGQTSGSAVTLERPIQVRQLIDHLEDITRENTSLTNPNSDLASEIQAEFRVLVVDDSFAVRKFLETKLPSLINMPMHISFAASGEEAMVKVGQTNFDIIFLDVVMGGVDGYKVCKAIKAKRSTYVVMLTGKKSPFNKVRGTMSGCNSYVTKPPSDEQLKDELQKCVHLQTGNLN